MHEPSSSALAAAPGTSEHRHIEQAHHDHDGDDHVSIPRMALTVFVVLCLLTGTSLLTYTTYWQEHVPMEVGRAVMLAVSFTKAFLVVAFFMHLWWEVKWKYVVTFPALTVSALLVISLVPDIGMRTQQYDAARLLNAPEAMPYTVGPELKVAQPTVPTANAAEHAADHADTPSKTAPSH